MKFAPGRQARERNAPLGPAAAGLTGAFGMKLFTGWLWRRDWSFWRAARRRRCPAPYTAASDVDAPYAAAPMSAGRLRPRCRRYAPGPRYGYGPRCCRRRRSTPCCATTGFRRSASRRLRGFVYTIAVIDRGGEDGRLVIDARNGRIIRFMPAYRIGGDNFDDDLERPTGPSGLCRRRPIRGAPRPPASSAAPQPSRPAPCRCREPRARRCRRPIRCAAKPAAAPVKQAAAPCSRSRPRCRQPPPATTGVGSSQARRRRSLPTQDMPHVQGLE